MKIIQSFWAAQQDPIDYNFGWYSPKYHWLGWILSVNQLRKFYDVELYTDSIGYKILIEKLKLPYSKVHIVLDELNQYPGGFWAIPKIKTYSLQKDPFLHVDGDIFIWEAFPDTLLRKGLITQNLEITTEYYHNTWKILAPKLNFIPDEMNDYINGTIHLACNMGIVGGKDLDFFRKYSGKSIEFVERNITSFSKKDQTNFNVFFEQVLFYLMTRLEKKEVSYLIEEISKDNDYREMGDFHRVPHEKTYLHLLGDYKRNKRVCKQLENYVLRYYPMFFERLAALDNSYFPFFESDLKNYTFSLEENNKRIDSLSHLNTLNADYLLSRDLASVNEPILFLENIAGKSDFSLEVLEGHSIKEKREQKAKIKYIEIQELDKQNTEIPIDEIDEMIFYQVKHTKKYYEILSNMLLALDEEALEMKNQFSQMIKDRIHFFLTQKVLKISS